MVATMRKSIAAFLASVVTWATAVVVSESTEVTSGEWVTLAGLAVAVIAVWLVPNEPADPR